MAGLEIALSILYLIGCVALIVLVLMQDSKSEGVNVITGGTETRFSNKKGKSKDDILSQLIIFLGVFFGALSLILGVILAFFNK